MKQHLLRQTDIDAAVKGVTKRRDLSDGAGLYLVISSPTSQSWVYRYKVGGVEKRMGLGSYPSVTLTQARKLAQKQRGLRADGIDPIAAKLERKRAGVTFEDAAREYWRTHCQDMAKPSNWIAAMEKDIFPRVGKRAVVDVLPEHLIAAFKPIWGREKARKLSQWVNQVITFVSVDDPRVDTQLMAKVKNRLGPQKVQYEHHAAVPWQDIPDLWVALPDTLVGYSMKLLILSAVRVNCVVQAEWSEFDFQEKVWTVPAERMKGWNVPFRVPLSKPMVSILRGAKRFQGQTQYVFESPDAQSGHLSNNAHRLWLHKHKWKSDDGRLATAHGMRSSFKDWSDDAGKVDHMVSEHCLQHVKAKGDATARAYFRTDQLERRREVMEAWGEYVTSGARKLIEYDKRQAALDAPADKDGRSLREIEDWARDDGNDDAPGMTEIEATEWARDDRIE